MRSRSIMWVFAIVFFSALAVAPGEAGQAANGGEYAGTWVGTWDGSGSGEFTLTLEKGKDGAPAGKVAVTTEQGNYDADLKGVSFNGKNMNATYDFPLDPSSEIAMAATFDAGKAKGTWSLRPKGGGTELVGGTFALAKK